MEITAEKKFSDKDMLKFLSWINVRCELGDYLDQYIFKGKTYNGNEIYEIYINTYYEDVS
jgi:hypothetical protein